MPGAGASRCRKGLNEPFNITAHRDQWSVRRPEESLRNAGSRASHSQPAIPGEAVSPLFPRRRHSAVLNAAAASEKGGIWAERRSEESEALGCVDPCCGVQAQPLLPPSGLRKSEATWLWWPGVVVVFVFVAVSVSRLSPLDASTSTFLLAFPWRFSWRST